MTKNSLQERDASVLWHPFTQVGFREPLLPVLAARDSKIILEDGTELLDATSSWWCCLHGHGRHELIDAASAQFTKLDHVLFAGCTHEPAVALAERLIRIVPPGLSRVFYSDNGSTAVEVALKMGVQYWANQGTPKTGIIALENSYHGDTFGAMSAGARGIFVAPFEKLLFEVHRVTTRAEIDDCAKFENLCRTGKIAAFIFEPRVQGAGGMLVYDTSAIDRYSEICERYGVITIADEVMTGFGRTGPNFASSSLQRTPDIICLSKGLTSGTLPLAITMCQERIFEAFISPDHARTFFHGHTYTANPIACSVALASLELFLAPQCLMARQRIEQSHRVCARKLEGFSAIQNVRVAGTLLAFDCVTTGNSGYLSTISRSAGDFFKARGILLRPLGNVIYCLPPYCISNAELKQLHNALLEFANHLETSGKPLARC